MKLEQMMLLGNLYKMYKGKDYEYNTLKNNEIFLSYPSTFNDPFDCFISIIKEEFEREFLKLKLPNDKYNEIRKYVNEVSFEWLRFFEHEKYLTPIRPFPACPPTIGSPETDRLENECWCLYEEYYKELNKIRDQYGIVCFTKNKPESNMVTRIIITDFVANMFLVIRATCAPSREETKNYTTCCLTWVKLDIEIRLYQLIVESY